jgi:hypothetical protein
VSQNRSSYEAKDLRRAVTTVWETGYDDARVRIERGCIIIERAKAAAPAHLGWQDWPTADDAPGAA